jgi:hypothetical protein
MIHLCFTAMMLLRSDTRHACELELDAQLITTGQQPLSLLAQSQHPPLTNCLFLTPCVL